MFVKTPRKKTEHCSIENKEKEVPVDCTEEIIEEEALQDIKATIEDMMQDLEADMKKGEDKKDTEVGQENLFMIETGEANHLEETITTTNTTITTTNMTITTTNMTTKHMRS